MVIIKLKNNKKNQKKNARPPLTCATKRTITNFIFSCGRNKVFSNPEDDQSLLIKTSSVGPTPSSF